MKYRIRFSKKAESEMENAVEYYENCNKGLGLDFSLEVKKAAERIADFPKAWQKISEKTRRCVLRRFPFGVIYQERESEIWIIAIAHLRKKPKN